MKIKVKLIVCEAKRIEEFTTDDLGYSDEEWSNLNGDDRDEAIREYVSDIEQPYWEIEKTEIAD